MAMTRQEFFAAERWEARRLCAKRLSEVEEMLDGTISLRRDHVMHEDMIPNGDPSDLARKASTSIQSWEERKRLCAKRLSEVEEMLDGTTSLRRDRFIHGDMTPNGGPSDLVRKASTFIQAAARGMAVRSTAGRKIAMARAKITEAAERAGADPSQVLEVKVRVALRSLERSNRTKIPIRACSVLELASRYSEVCCGVIAEGRGPRNLYDLARRLNRSPPHERIRTYVLRTLRNIALEGSRLAVMIAAPRTAVATLVDLAKVVKETLVSVQDYDSYWRTLGLRNFPHRQEVFLPTVRLLRQLVAARQPSMDACNRPTHLKRLEGLRTILARRAAEEAKCNSKATSNATIPKNATKSLRAIDLLFDELSRE